MRGSFFASLRRLRKRKRNADRRGNNHPHRPGAAPLRPDGLGGAARLSAFHRGSRQGDLRHPRRNSGHVSWDAVWPVLSTFACPSPASTSRAGRNAGRHDTQAARERAVSSRPRAPHSLSTSGIPSRKASWCERAGARYISLGRLSHHVSVTGMIPKPFTTGIAPLSRDPRA